MSLFRPDDIKIKAEQVIKAPYQYEHHEERPAEGEIAKPNARFVHDPFWRSRFWSIQHVHDVAEGKAWHWFWTPIKGAFGVAQIAFVTLPVAAYLSSRGSAFSFWHIILFGLVAELLFVAVQNGLEALYWWRFERAKRKA